MVHNKYTRTIEELRQHAVLFWPDELSKKETEISVIPKLLETQDQFIAILGVKVDNIEKLFEIINSSSMKANLFLKHMVVLSDFGGEFLMRVNRELSGLFPDRKINYIWRGNVCEYKFKALPVKGMLNNDRLGISGKKLLDSQEMSNLHKDVLTLLLVGNACVDENTARILSKCEIINYVGQPDKLDKYIKQRYIWVSRITSGAQSNSLGHIAQDYVKNFLQKNIGIEGVEVKSDSTLPGVSHAAEGSGSDTNFDITVRSGKKYVAVEVSFQVTTNSVIERKAGQSRARYAQIKEKGFGIAYVLDGAGNFQRESALRTICSYSDCTVAFKKDELEVLCDYIRTFFKK